MCVRGSSTHRLCFVLPIGIEDDIRSEESQSDHSLQTTDVEGQRDQDDVVAISHIDGHEESAGGGGSEATSHAMMNSPRPVERIPSAFRSPQRTPAHANSNPPTTHTTFVSVNIQSPANTMPSTRTTRGERAFNMSPLSSPVAFEVEQSNRFVNVKRRYKCTEAGCKKDYVSKYARDRHISSAHTNDQFNCSKCTKHFCHRGLLERHVREAHQPKKFQCKTCGRYFVRKGYASSHCREK